MARRRSSSRRSRQREVPRFASPPLPRLTLAAVDRRLSFQRMPPHRRPRRALRPRTILRDAEDRRLRRPEREAPPRTVAGVPMRRILDVRAYRDAFVNPRLVAICVRRRRRREVLHALKRTNGQGARRRNVWSNVRC